VDIVAVDWSGRATLAGQRRHIWMAVVRDGELKELDHGFTRGDLVDALMSRAAADPEMIVGLDFSFSFPAWFLAHHGATDVAEFWEIVGQQGEGWLAGCRPPFWGRPGTTRPDGPDQLRVTDRSFPPIGGIRPKSVFQIGGAGAVGTGTIRGLPHLLRLQRAGFAIWPFTGPGPGRPLAIEAYPRSMTGPVNKSSPIARAVHLESWPMPAELRQRAEQSDDAFDAAITALRMSRHVDELRALAATADPVARLEGSIWVPGPMRG
jgi:hypothetical protein